MENNLHLKNYTEILIDEAIEKLWFEMDDICKCERCYYDTKAIALNHLPSKYTVTSKGEVYTKINNFRNQIQVDVMKEVMKAIMVVNEHRSHNEEETVKY